MVDRYERYTTGNYFDSFKKNAPLPITSKIFFAFPSYYSKLQAYLVYPCFS